MLAARNKQAGFTLTELMIVVVIVGILAAIGYPNYQNFVREAKRSDAHATLSHMAAQQERYFSDQNGYALSLTTLGYSSATAISQEGHWQVALNGTATAFTISATPANGHSDDDCATITLNSAGLKAAKNASSAAVSTCW